GTRGIIFCNKYIMCCRAAKEGQRCTPNSYSSICIITKQINIPLLICRQALSYYILTRYMFRPKHGAGRTVFHKECVKTWVIFVKGKVSKPNRVSRKHPCYVCIPRRIGSKGLASVKSKPVISLPS